MPDLRRRNASTAVILLSVAAGMVGLTFAAVPLYQVLCKVTGLGGTPRIHVAERSAAATDRMITVRFDTNVNPALPWQFRPAQKEMTVRLGETVRARFVAKNLSDKRLVGTAAFNVTPFKAGPYFNKIHCFCFTEQSLAPGQEVSLPVSFFVDPDIYADPGTRDVHTITLSYTFFRAPGEDRGKGNGAAGPGRTVSSGEERRTHDSG